MSRITLYEQKQNLRRMRWLLFWIVISQNIFTMIYKAITSFISPSPGDFVRILIIEIAAFVVPLMVYGKSGGMDAEKNPHEALRLQGFTVGQGILIVILAVTGQFITILLNAPAVWLRLEFFGHDSVNALIPKNLTDMLIGVVSIAAVPAIMEELLMRGIVLSTLERQSTVAAITFSTVIFALLHANVYDFAGILFMGIILAVITLRTASLYAAMLYHFTTNLTALFIGYFILWFNSSYAVIFVFLSAVAVFMVGMIVLKMITPRIKYKRNKNALNVMMSNIFSIPILLCIILTIAVQIIN